MKDIDLVKKLQETHIRRYGIKEEVSDSFEAGIIEAINWAMMLCGKEDKISDFKQIENMRNFYRYNRWQNEEEKKGFLRAIDLCTIWSNQENSDDTVEFYKEVLNPPKEKQWKEVFSIDGNNFTWNPEPNTKLVVSDKNGNIQREYEMEENGDLFIGIYTPYDNNGNVTLSVNQKEE